MCGVYFRFSSDENLEDFDSCDKANLGQLSCRGPDGIFQKKNTLEEFVLVLRDWELDPLRKVINHMAISVLRLCLMVKSIIIIT